MLACYAMRCMFESYRSRLIIISHKVRHCDILQYTIFWYIIIYVTIVSSNDIIVTKVLKKSFRCAKCYKYSPRLKCYICYPSPAFPLPCCRPRPDPRKDFDKYKEWDEWYVEFYLMEFDEDPEEKYLVGATR